MIDFGPRHEELVAAWAETIGSQPEGEGYDFTRPTRSAQVRDRVQTFLDSPTEEGFEAIWSPDVIRNAVYGGPGSVLNNWNRPIDELAAFVETLQTADSYSEEWERHFPAFATRGLWELYGRLDPEERPIVNTWVGRAFGTFGLPNPQSYRDSAEQVEAIRERYEETVGHVTAGTSHEVPLYDELEQFLFVVETCDESELRATLGLDVPRYDSFAGWDAMTAHGGEIELTGLRSVLDAFTTAANSDAYDSENPLEHWGANHWETWKDEYCDYLETDVFPTYDPTALESGEVGAFIDALTDSNVLGSDVPIYLLGGRWQPWDNFESISASSTGAAATVLSSLMDDDSGPITDRLQQFNDFYAAVSDSGSERMSVATFLLMAVYPERYVMYRYSMFEDFFEAFSDYDVPTGFNPSDYVLMNDALHGVRADLDEYVDDDVRMLDVHSLLWVYHRQGPP